MTHLLREGQADERVKDSQAHVLHRHPLLHERVRGREEGEDLAQLLELGPAVRVHAAVARLEDDGQQAAEADDEVRQQPELHEQVAEVVSSDRLQLEHLQDAIDSHRHDLADVVVLPHVGRDLHVPHEQRQPAARDEHLQRELARLADLVHELRSLQVKAVLLVDAAPKVDAAVDALRDFHHHRDHAHQRQVPTCRG